MSLFTYKYIDQDGQQRRGTVKANSQRVANRMISTSDHIVLSIQPANTLSIIRTWLDKDIGGKRSLALVEQASLARSMAMLIASGLTMEQALLVLKSSTLNKKTSSVVKSLLRGVRRGQTLSESFANLEVRFDSYFLGLIQIAERSGKFEQCLSSISNALTKKHKSRSSLLSALLYPAVLMVTSIVTFGFLFAFVIPKLRKLFIETGNELPLVTKVILQISDGLQLILPFFPFFVIVIMLLFISIYSQSSGQRVIQSTIIRLPIIGPIVQLSEASLLSRSLGIALQTGMIASEALSVSAKNLGLKLYRKQVEALVLEVRQGTTLSGGFKKMPRLFPARFVQLLEIGEQSGQLSATMHHIADIIDDELETRRSKISSLTTPVFLLFFGGLTALVMFAVWSSVLSLNDTVLN